jgi:hypothetical protein
MINYLCVLWWEVALKVRFDASFCNMSDRTGTRVRAGQANSTKAYVTTEETSC